MPRQYSRQQADQRRVRQLVAAAEGVRGPDGRTIRRRGDDRSGVTSSQARALLDARSALGGVTSARSQNLTTSRPVGGGSITSGAGSVIQQSEAGLANLRGVQQDTRHLGGRGRMDTTNTGGRGGGRSSFGSEMAGLIDQGQAHHDRFNTERSLADISNERASFVGRVSTSQRDARAINKLVQSGKRRVRGASVALPRITGGPSRRPLLR